MTPKPPQVSVAKPKALSSARLRGHAKLGRKLTCKDARFTHATKLGTSWLRNGKTIKGAKKSTYKVTKKDLGKKLACRTTATGAGGTARNTSAALKGRR